MSGPDYSTGVILGRLVRLAADLAIIAIGVIMCLAAVGTVTIR